MTKHWREPLGTLHWHVYIRHGYGKEKQVYTFTTRQKATDFLTGKRDELVADGLPIIAGHLSRTRGEIGVYTLGELELYSEQYYELSGCACETARCETPLHDDLAALQSGMPS